MNRRSFLKKACLGFVTLTLPAPAFAKTKSQKPDIVLIMADDIGISDIGCYGGEIETPNIDWLAADGVKFRNFYCEPMCVPARATTLTGIYENNSLKKPGGLNKATLSIAEVLRENGYATAMSGKWHLGTGDNIPFYRGFDRFYGTTEGCGSFFAPLSLMRNDKNAEDEFMDKDYYYTDAITDNAINYVKETSKDQPLLLYVAYTAAHWPLHAKPEDIDKYKGKYAMGWDELRNQRFKRMKKLGVIDKKTKLSPRDPDVPAWKDAEHKEWQQRRMEVYAAQIDSMDQNIGRLIECLKKTGRLDNTIIMFTIDNGGCHVEYETTRTGSFLNKTTRDGRPLVPGNIPGLMPGPEVTFQSYGRGWANASNTPYRLFKQYAHQGGDPQSSYYPMAKWHKEKSYRLLH
jgi:arylsulfatase